MKNCVVIIKGVKASFLKVEELYRRISVIPIPNTTAERSFSKMRSTKTFNQAQDTLTLIAWSIEREKVLR